MYIYMSFPIILVLGSLFFVKNKLDYLKRFGLFFAVGIIVSNFAIPIYGMVFGFGGYCMFAWLLAIGIFDKVFDKG